MHMNNNKKPLFMLAVGLIASFAITVVAINNNVLAKDTYASGIVEDGKNRFFTLNSSLSIDGDGVGTLTVGNIGIYAPDCTALDSGVATLNDGQLVLYCATAGMNGDFYKGFARATLSSLSITFDSDGSSESLNFYWAKFKNTFKTTTSTTYTTKTMSSDAGQQTISLTGSDTFISGQGGAKDGSYVCIYIYTGSKVPIDLYSLTIEYTCK